MCGAFSGERKQAFVAISQNIFTISFPLLWVAFQSSGSRGDQQKRECEGLLILIKLRSRAGSMKVEINNNNGAHAIQRAWQQQQQPAFMDV